MNKSLKADFLRWYLILFSIQFFFNSKLFSQGAGDPGIGIFDFHSREDFGEMNSISIGFLYGISDKEYLKIPNSRMDVSGQRTISNLVLGYRKSFNKKAYVDVNLLASHINGLLASNSNLSDILATVNWKLFRSKNGRMNVGISSGLKIPLTSSNDRVKEFLLPMAYQTSLGTFDFLTAVAASYRGAELVVGAQSPIISINRNEFLSYEGTLSYFAPTYHFRRGSDLFSRFSWRWKIKSFWIMPSAQAFFRIQEDSYKNPNTGSYISFEDRYFDFSVQANIHFGYHINKNISLQIFAAASGNSPRNDGLDRRYQGGLTGNLKL